jgi:hypothetical protein
MSHENDRGNFAKPMHEHIEKQSVKNVKFINTPKWAM